MDSKTTTAAGAPIPNPVQWCPICSCWQILLSSRCSSASSATLSSSAPGHIDIHTDGASWWKTPRNPQAILGAGLPGHICAACLHRRRGQNSRAGTARATWSPLAAEQSCTRHVPGGLGCRHGGHHSLGGGRRGEGTPVGVSCYCVIGASILPSGMYLTLAVATFDPSLVSTPLLHGLLRLGASVNHRHMNPNPG